MKILILYSIDERNSRNTINEHLFSFKKFGNQCDFHYLNVFNAIPKFIFRIKYDAVIFHYTFLAEKRFLESPFDWSRKIKNVSRIQGYKVAFPQDEYDATDRLCALFKEGGIDVIYTCFTNEADINKAYPKAKAGVEKIKKTFTGYINDDVMQLLSKKHIVYDLRPIDIGYRARKLPAYFGKHGQLKYELVSVFNNALINSKLRTDIQNTNDNFIVENAQAIKLGFSWYDFLLSCKAFIGCEGGSSLLDADGEIKRKVKKYLEIKPNASFEEIEMQCFPGQDYNITCFALSPRHFEAAMTKTLQILVEGEYGGIFKPWEHYVPLKRDFTNINEVIRFLENEEGCLQIVENAYKDIVMSGKYTYKTFVSEVIDDIRIEIGRSSKKYNRMFFNFLGKIIRIRNVVCLYSSLIRKKIVNLLKV